MQYKNHEIKAIYHSFVSYDLDDNGEEIDSTQDLYVTDLSKYEILKDGNPISTDYFLEDIEEAKAFIDNQESETK